MCKSLQVIRNLPVLAGTKPRQSVAARPCRNLHVLHRASFIVRKGNFGAFYRPKKHALRNSMQRGVVVALICLTLIFGSTTANMLAGGFSSVSDHANDASVNAAKDVATKGLTDKGLKGPLKVEVVSAERQVVAGTNYRLKLKVQDANMDNKFYQATIWEKLPAYGGAMELSKLDEISAEAAGMSCHDEQQVLSSDPGVDEAAAYAVEQLSQQSNSLFPFVLKEIVSTSSKKSASNDETTHHLKLKLKQGDMPEQTFEVEVAHSSSAFFLRNSQVASN